MNQPATIPAAAADILRAASRLTGLSIESIVSPGRNRRQADARLLATSVLRQATAMSLKEISLLMGNSDASGGTVCSALKSVAARIRQDDEFAGLYRQMIAGREIRRPLPEPFQALAKTRKKYTGRKPVPGGPTASVAYHGHLRQLCPAALRTRVKNAEEELAYWTGAKARAATDRDRIAAGARVHIWTAEVKSARELLNQHALTHPENP